jgi:hypothetical protein
MHSGMFGKSDILIPNFVISNYLQFKPFLNSEYFETINYARF